MIALLSTTVYITEVLVPLGNVIIVNFLRRCAVASGSIVAMDKTRNRF